MYSEKKKKTPGDGQRNCPKHVEFYSKNKFEKLANLVGFIIRIHQDARSPERQKSTVVDPSTEFIYFRRAEGTDTPFLQCVHSGHDMYRV